MRALRSAFERCLAAALAFALLFSNTSLTIAVGAASTDAEVISAGELVADNYELDAAMEDVLASGLLMGETFIYTEPSDDDGLVTVDIESRTVSADNYFDGTYTWKPAYAEILVDGEVYETIDLAQGSRYTYEGNAFAVRVSYQLYQSVAIDTQIDLINTSGWLKRGVANMDKLNAQTGNLGLLEAAMPELVNLANNGITVPNLGAVNLSDEGIAAVRAMNAEMAANGGKLDLSVITAAYEDAESKVKYLLTEGETAYAEVCDFAEKIQTISTALNTIKSAVDSLVNWGYIDRETGEKLSTLANVTSSLNVSVKALASDSTDWTAAKKGTALVKSGITTAEYQRLDALVAALGDTVSICVDKTNDHECDYCGAVISTCIDRGSDGLCDTCGMTMGPCAECVDTDKDHRCNGTGCGNVISVCVDSDNNGLCNVCGGVVYVAPGFELRERLLAATVAVQANLSMMNVTVEVKLNVVEDAVNSAVLVSGGSEHSIQLTMDEGTTLAEIAAAVAASGIEATARNSWERYVHGQYVPTVTVDPAVETLTEDITYTITYSPKMYTVTFGKGYDGAPSIQLPYGYRMELEANADPERVYDYSVNGAYYAQGSVYTITGDVTIGRESGKPYTKTDFYTVVAGNFATEKERGILTSGALLGNEAVNVRYPDADSENLVTMSENVLTANSYRSDYAGRIWMPYSYAVINGTEKTTHYFNGQNSVTVQETSFDSIVVVYRLVLDNFEDARVLEALRLPGTLVEEAAGQKAALDQLSRNRASMARLDKTTLLILGTLIENTTLVPSDPATGVPDPVKNAELQAYFKAVVSDITANCIDTNGYLKIYNMLEAYQDPENGGLAYYYANGDAVLAEVDLLAEYLGMMLADEEKITAVELLVTAAGKPEYADRISGLSQLMDDAREQLTAPNAAIDKTSGNLKKLVSALEAEGETKTYTAIPEPGKLTLFSAEFVVAASTKAAIKVTLELAGATRTVSVTFNKGYVLTEDDISAMKAEIDAAVVEVLGSNARYYGSDYANGTGLDALVNTALTASRNFTYTWTAKTYEVLVEGTAPQNISIDNLMISLPACEEEGFRYDYVVDGQVVSSGYYTFTLAQIDRLFSFGSYSVARIRVDLAKEKLEHMVDALNAAVGAGSFALTEAGGRYTKLTARVGMDGLMGMIMGLTTSGYGYVGLNDRGLVYTENGTFTISLQTLVDAMLCDETFGSETMIALAANGSGTFLRTTMQLGDSADLPEQDLDFEIILTSVPAEMAATGSALAGLRDQFAFRAGSGVLEATLILSEEDFAFSLTGLIMTGNLNLSDVNQLATLAAYQFLEGYIKAVFGGDVTADTLTNTLEKMGQSSDQALQDDYFQQMKNILGTDHLISTPDGYEITMVTTAEELNDSLAQSITDPVALENARTLIKECRTGEGLVIDTRVAVANLADENGDGIADTDYEAVVLGLGAAQGSVPMLSAMTMTDDLVEWLAARSEGALVILQQDIVGDLNFGGAAMLDLNGHTVYGDVTSAGLLAIYDSTMDSAASGGVTGSVSGADVRIFAGTYTADVSRYLEAGSVQNVSGTVVNQLFTITEGSDGGITVDVNAGMLELETRPSRLLTTMNLMPELMMKFGAAAALTVDGTELYAYSAEDMFELMADENAMNHFLLQTNIEGVKALTDDIYAEMLNFAAVEQAIRDNRPISSSAVAVAPWILTMIHDQTEDCLDLGVAPGETRRPVAITVQVAGEQAQRDALAELNGGLKETMSVTVTNNVETVEDQDGKVTIETTRHVVMTVDLSRNPDFAVVVGVMLAYAGTNTDTIVAALETCLNENAARDLRIALAEVTFDQLMAAIQTMEKDVSFADMAEHIGLTADASRAAALEGIYHNFLVGIGWEMTAGEPVTDDQTLGEDGIFEISKDTTVDAADSGSGALDDLFSDSQEQEPYVLSLTIKVFGYCDHEWDEGTISVHPTCTGDGTRLYTCRQCTESYTVNIPAIGHAWGDVEYVWAADNLMVTATRVCGHDAGHVETETVGVTVAEVSPTCTEDGKYIYTSNEFTNLAFYVQTREEPISATGHEWGDPEYIWAEDHSEVTARRVCGNDGEHVETETVETTEEVTPATCTEDGKTVYTAAFANPAFSTQTKEVPISATGHEWGDPEYIWAEDHSEVTARRVCGNDGEHVETETVETVKEVTPATCTEDGKTVYTAEFANPAFDKQTKEVTISATGHEWGDPEYIWAEDHSEVTARRVCGNDSEHVETETVETVKEVTPATCTEEGKAVYTAEFANPAFDKQTKEVPISATGHEWGEWADTGDGATHKKVCANDPGHEESAPHSYDSGTDTSCNDCGYVRTIETPDPGPGPVDPDPGPVDPDPGPVDPDPGPVDPDPGPGIPGPGPSDPGPVDPDPVIPGPGSGNTVVVTTVHELMNAVSSAKDGDTITIGRYMSMTKDIQVDAGITIKNVRNLNLVDYMFYLAEADAKITCDGTLNVGSEVDGYYPVRDGSTGTWTLKEISAPKTGGLVAGSKVEKLKSVRYLFLDLDPSKGMSLTALGGETGYEELNGYRLEFTVSENDGSGLVRTSDRLVVSAWNDMGRQVMQVSYVVIVMGDTNCNGKVNTSDATVLKNINFGQSYGFEIRLAADSNFSGTMEAPKINSSDEAYIKSKWFAWDLNKYVSNMK